MAASKGTPGVGAGQDGFSRPDSVKFEDFTSKADQAATEVGRGTGAGGAKGK